MPKQTTTDPPVKEHSERDFYKLFDLPIEDDAQHLPQPAGGANLEIDQKKNEAPVASPFKAIKRFDIKDFTLSQLEIEQRAGTPFLLVPIFLIVGAASYFALPTEPALHNIPATLLILTVLRIALYRAAIATKYCVNALLLCTFAMGLAQWHTHYIATPILGSPVVTRIYGEIEKIEERPNGSVRYTIDIISTERPTLRYGLSRIRVTARKPAASAQIGEGIYGIVSLAPPSGPARPGGFDFAFNNYFQRIGANGFFFGQPHTSKIFQKSKLSFVSTNVEVARHWLSKHIRNYGDSDISAVSAALITGDKAAISDEITEALRKSGLAHILSISGLHMALVAGTVMFTIRLLGALAPNWSARRPVKKYAAIAGFGAITIYLFLAGASIATQRSFIMLAIMLGALMGNRAALTMRNLAIAAIIVIALAPQAVTSPGFQMSFAATIALIAVYGAWQKRHNHKSYDDIPTGSAKLWRGIGAFFITLSMTSLIAGAATGIYSAYHFQRIALFGLAGNLLAMPVISLITMPSAILGTLLIPTGLDGILFSLMNLSVRLVVEIAKYVADHAPSGLTGALAPWALLSLTAFLLIFCIAKSKLKYASALCLLPLMIANPTPKKALAVISEDAKQVAIIDQQGQLILNRDRPNSFIIDQWMAAYKALKILKPNHEDEGGFQCENKYLCTYLDSKYQENPSLLWKAQPIEDPQERAKNCEKFDVIILSYAPAAHICDEAKTLVITAQQLAKRGSAEIVANKTSGAPKFKALFALSDNDRPWTAHRKYSRSARNLASHSDKEDQ